MGKRIGAYNVLEKRLIMSDVYHPLLSELYGTFAGMVEFFFEGSLT
jgi:hypothetical protein